MIKLIIYWISLCNWLIFYNCWKLQLSCTLRSNVILDYLRPVHTELTTNYIFIHQQN